MCFFCDSQSPGGLRGQYGCGAGGSLCEPDRVTANVNFVIYGHCYSVGLDNSYIHHNGYAHGLHDHHGHTYVLHHDNRYTSLSDNCLAYDEYDADTDSNGNASLHDYGLAYHKSG